MSAWDGEGGPWPRHLHTAGCRLKPGPAEPAVSSSKMMTGAASEPPLPLPFLKTRVLPLVPPGLESTGVLYLRGDGALESGQFDVCSSPKITKGRYLNSWEIASCLKLDIAFRELLV